ncbi:MAG: hypothetical protein HYR48_03745 [Gemmatimonadetes bacterium]|nr:hypothetical protein [Gemmatimonadota bacterium]
MPGEIVFLDLVRTIVPAVVIVILAFSPVGRALANRILHGKQPVGGTLEDPRVEELSDEVSSLRRQIGEMQERIDFAERMLARARTKGVLGAGPER